jgi:hypothetical protein
MAIAPSNLIKIIIIIYSQTVEWFVFIHYVVVFEASRYRTEEGLDVELSLRLRTEFTTAAAVAIETAGGLIE